MWVNTKRTTPVDGGERFPDGAPNISNSNTRACSGGQPGLLVDDDGSILLGFSSGQSHEGVNAISAFMRSTDGGSKFGDPALDVFTIDIHPQPTDHRSLFSSWKKLKYGTKKGRIVAVGARGYVVNTEQYDSYCFINDGPDRTTGWRAVKLPQVETYYTIGISVDQLPSNHALYPNRVVVGMYTRRLGFSGARSYCVFSDDYGDTWQTYQDYTVHTDPVSGDPGVIGSDGITFVTEYKECCLGVLPNGNLMCLIRSDDSQRKIYSSFSTDGGRTWTAPALAFLGYNFPAWCALDDGTCICATRHTSAATDGNDYAEGFESLDNGVTWSAGWPLYDPRRGIGSSPGCCPIQLPNGRLGVIITWCVPPSGLFAQWMLEYTEWTRSPRTPGEFSHPDWSEDQNRIHPSKTLTDGSGNSTAFLFLTVEDLRQQYQATSTAVQRWTNLIGNPHWNMVPSASGGMKLMDGSLMISPNGCVGGKGIVTSTGAEAMAAEGPVALTQPLCLIFIGDGTVPVSQLTLVDDGQGFGVYYTPTGGGRFIVNVNGVSQFFTPPSGFPGGRSCFALALNGSSTQLRHNGVALAVQSGGPLSGAVTVKHLRLGGVGGANFWRGLRWVIGAQTSDLTKIAAYESLLINQHRING